MHATTKYVLMIRETIFSDPLALVCMLVMLLAFLFI
jgi:hypothetical protein